jgi:hypothetical protein
MNHTEFELRLQKLESRVNRYRLTSMALGLGVIGLIGVAATTSSEPSQELRTHRLVIVDSKGKEAAHFQTGPHGGIINLLNSDGIPVVRAGASDKGGKLALADVKGTQYIELTSEDTGGEVLISDKKGQKNAMKATMVHEK